MPYRTASASRIERRRFLGAAAALGVSSAAAIAAGCSQPEAPVATPAQTTGKRGGILVRRSLRSGVFPRGLDPHVQARSSTALMGLIYQTLTRLDPQNLTVQPGLAAKWESPSPTTLVLTLQPDVFWHDKPPVGGRALVADDVVFTLERVGGSDPKFVYSTLLDMVDRIEAVDRQTVRLTLREPDVALLNNLACPSWAILAPEVVQRFGDKFTGADSAIGTGAFALSAIDDTSATLVRNDKHWRRGLPYLDGIRLVDLRDPQAMWAAFLAKQLDLAHPPGAEAHKLEADTTRTDTDIAWVPDDGHQQVSFNTRRAPFLDSRVSRALRFLLDHDEAMSGWAEVWFGKGYLGSYMPATLHEWDFSESEYRSQFLEWRQPKQEAAQQAQSLLSAAGYSRDNPYWWEISPVRENQWAS
jgi:peptide/nickel transport system substrate-binding protein